MDTSKKKISKVQLISFALIAFLTVDVVLLTIQNRVLKNNLKGTALVGGIEPL